MTFFNQFFFLISIKLFLLFFFFFCNLNLFLQQKKNFQKRCTLPTNYEFYFWFLPLGVTLFLNLVFYSILVFKVRSIKKFEKVHDVVVKRVLMYITAFIICWIWDFLNHLFSSFNCYIYPFYLLQTFFSPLQGFINFLVYGITKSRPGDPKERILHDTSTSENDYASKRYYGSSDN